MITATEQDIREVQGLVAAVAAAKYPRHKKDKFTELVQGLTDNQRTLTAFLCWFCLSNTRFHKIETSRYHFLPEADSNAATMEDFITMVKYYERSKITISREAELCKFLAKCDSFHKDFFLLVMSHGFTVGLPMAEVQAELDLDQFSTEELYSHATALRTKFADLEYPVFVRPVPATDLRLVLLAKEPHSIRMYNVLEGGYLETGPPTADLLRDVKCATTSRFSMLGYLASDGVLYPVAIFSSLQEYKGSIVSGATAQHMDIAWYFQSNMVTYIDDSNVSYIIDGEAAYPIKSVVGTTAATKLLVYDGSVVRNTPQHYVEARIAHGVVEELWVEDGVAEGLTVWFNGELRKCSYDFTGNNNAMLGSIDLMNNKPIAFYYVTMGAGITYLIGKELKWRDKAWRTSRLRGSDIWIEKCVFCGSVSRPHDSRGMCRVCYHSLFHHFSKCDKDVWMPSSPQKLKDRQATCWEPSLLNAVNYQHQGYVVKAKGDKWGFFSDDEAMSKYLEWREKQDGK